MRKDKLNVFNSALFKTFESAFEKTSSEYDAYIYVRRALLHYVVTGEVDKFSDENARLNMQTVITQDEVVRHLADYLFLYTINNEPKTRTEKRFKSQLEKAEKSGMNEAQIMKMIIDCISGKQDKFLDIESSYITAWAIRAYVSEEIGKIVKQQREYDLKLATKNNSKYGITSVKVNREALNLCRQEIIDGSQISIQNDIRRNNIRNGRVLQRPRREYQLDDDLFAVSDIGMHREDQEDSVLILKHPLNPNYKMMVVADGVGGYAGGEKASREAVLSMIEWFESLNPEFLKETNKNELVAMWNERLLSLNDLINDKYPGAGSTFVGAIVGEKSTVIGSVGDSRAYLLDNNLELRQVTMDDNKGYKDWERRWGRIYKESRTGKSKVTIDKMLDEKDKVRFKRDSNVILASLGIADSITPHFVSFPNESYKTLLLLSDGVTDCLSDKELMVITRQSSPKDIARDLIDVALKNDSYRKDLEDNPEYFPRISAGKDNATAIVYHRDKGGKER